MKSSSSPRLVCGFLDLLRARMYDEKSAGLAYPAATVALLSIFYREARMRFRELLRWDLILSFF